MNENQGVVEAELQFGQRRVRYVRAGEGPVVLLLRAPRNGQVGVPWDIFHPLATRHRVVAPVEPLPSRRDEAERWIRGVVEALGLRSPEVVAEAELAPLLSRFVRRNGGLVGRVVFLPAGEGAGEGAGGLAAEVAGEGTGASVGPLPKRPPRR